MSTGGGHFTSLKDQLSEQCEGRHRLGIDVRVKVSDSVRNKNKLHIWLRRILATAALGHGGP